MSGVHVHAWTDINAELCPLPRSLCLFGTYDKL